MALGKRGRPSKEDVRRRSAVVKAMSKYGFGRDIVLHKIKELTKAYDGDDGWRFIEDDCYKVLVDSLTDKQNVKSGFPRRKDVASQQENVDSCNFNQSQELLNAQNKPSVTEITKMAPGKRGRPSKEDVRRRNAAVEAMTMYGFGRDVVLQKIKELVKAYHGYDGWRFIEDGCYKVLVDSLTNKQNVKPGLPQWKDVASQHENGKSPNFNQSRSQELPNALNTSRSDLTEEDQIMIPQSIQPQEKKQRSCVSRDKRHPFYCWLGSSDPDDYVLLPPIEVLRSTPRERLVRQPKWDVRY